MLTTMDLPTASAGPWLLLGVVLGLLLAGGAALAFVGLRGRARVTVHEPGTTAARVEQPAEGASGAWTEDDLPGFLEHPPGVPESAPTREHRQAGDRPLATAATGVPSLAAPVAARGRAGGATAYPRRPVPAHAADRDRDTGRLLVGLATVALLLIGVAAALAALAPEPRSNAATTTPPEVTPRPGPTWTAPDLTPVPEQPEPGDPGAGELATASVPVGEDGVLARAEFGGIVLERRAVGVTAAYPSVSVTATAIPGGPALAHVRLPLWNCLTDAAPADPVAAGCRRLPTEHADLPTPALSVADEGEGVRISGRFATYVRPTGSPPEWTGRVYPLAVRITPDGDGVTGTLHLGTERAEALTHPRLGQLRRGR